jgi:uncharacterized protein (DUF885 family)
MENPREVFRDAASAAVEDVLRHEPETATALGDHRYDDRLNDLSKSGLRSARIAYTRHLETIREIQPGTLEIDDRVDQATLVGALEERIFFIDELDEAAWDPLVYNPGDALYPLLARDTIPVPDRLRAIAARLGQVPELLDLARRQLVRPPRIHVETALQQNPGTIELVRDEVSHLLESDLSMSAVVEPAQARALEALENHASLLEGFLETDRRNGDDGRDFRIGAERFARKLELTLNSSLTTEEIQRQAHDFLEAVTSDIEEAARNYVTAQNLGTAASDADAVRLALEHVARTHPDDATVVDVARHALDGAVSEVRANGIATVPDDEMCVQVMPEFRRGVAVAYCDSPGPLEQGGQTFLAVAPTPDSWSAERVSSFYREYNSAMITDLIVHEAMPGHALQLAHGRKFSGSTPVRQVFMSGSFIEGWAVHAERLMAESGHGGAPVRLQQLKMQLRMTINAILDAGVHAGSMTEAEALKLMRDQGFQEEGEAAGKWRRACLTSAQLSTYFVGYVELAELFSQLGPISGYDQVLSHGSPPPRLLASLLGAAS